MITGKLHHTLYTSTGSITRRIPENMRGTSEHYLGSRVVMACAVRLFYARVDAGLRPEKGSVMTATKEWFYRYLAENENRGASMALFKPGFLKGPIANWPYDQCNVIIGPYRCVEDYGHQGQCVSARIEFSTIGQEVEVEFSMGDFTIERWIDIRVRYERERHKRGESRYVLSECDGFHPISDDC